MTTQAQNGVPTRSLYIGAAGEHHIMSECFRRQMEAFKLPIDKGFDLVVTNAYRHVEPFPDASAERSELPVYLQVKSLQAELRAQQPGQRPEWRGGFRIKRSDLALLLRTPNSALACVLFIEEDSSAYMRGRTAFAWWHPSAHLRDLEASGHFVEDDESPECVRLNVLFRGCADGAPNQNAYLVLRRKAQGWSHSRQLANGDTVPLAQFDFGALNRLGADPR